MKNATIVLLAPSASPAAKKSFTSPPPIARPPLSMKRMNNGTLIISMPAIWLITAAMPVFAPVAPPIPAALHTVTAAPQININTFIPNGISYVLQSMTLRTMSADIMRHCMSEIMFMPFVTTVNVHKTAFRSSIAGYWTESFVPQQRHLPLSAIHATIGMLSYQASLCPHVMQCDGSFTMSSLRGIL